MAAEFLSLDGGVQKKSLTADDDRAVKHCKEQRVSGLLLMGNGARIIRIETASVGEESCESHF